MTGPAAVRARVLEAAVFLGLIGVWDLTARFVVPPQFLPSPGAVFLALLAEIRSGELVIELGHTLGVLVAGFGLALISGIAIGAAMGTFRAFGRLADPYVHAFNAMPVIALVPLAIIWLGLGFAAKVFLTWIVSVAPIVISTEAGVTGVPQEFIDTARTFGCTRWQTFRRVVSRAAAPFVVAGIRLGLGRALVGVVVAEMFTALDGLGAMIVLDGNTFRTADLFVPIVVLAGLGAGLTAVVRRVERRLAPWRTVRD